MKLRGQQAPISGYICHKCREGEKEEPLKKEYADRIRTIQV